VARKGRAVTTRLLAYHGDPAIKAKYLARARAHREADELLRLLREAPVV